MGMIPWCPYPLCEISWLIWDWFPATQGDLICLIQKMRFCHRQQGKTINSTPITALSLMLPVPWPPLKMTPTRAWIRCLMSSWRQREWGCWSWRSRWRGKWLTGYVHVSKDRRHWGAQKSTIAAACKDDVIFYQSLPLQYGAWFSGLKVGLSDRLLLHWRVSYPVDYKVWWNQSLHRIIRTLYIQYSLCNWYSMSNFRIHRSQCTVRMSRNLHSLCNRRS